MNESCPIFNYIKHHYRHDTLMRIMHIYNDLWEITLENPEGKVFIKRIVIKYTAHFADRYPAKI